MAKTPAQKAQAAASYAKNGPAKRAYIACNNTKNKNINRDREAGRKPGDEGYLGVPKDFEKLRKAAEEEELARYKAEQEERKRTGQPKKGGRPRKFTPAANALEDRARSSRPARSGSGSGGSGDKWRGMQNSPAVSQGAIDLDAEAGFAAMTELEKAQAFADIAGYSLPPDTGAGLPQLPGAVAGPSRRSPSPVAVARPSRRSPSPVAVARPSRRSPSPALDPRFRRTPSPRTDATFEAMLEGLPLDTLSGSPVPSGSRRSPSPATLAAMIERMPSGTVSSPYLPTGSRRSPSPATKAVAAFENIPDTVVDYDFYAPIDMGPSPGPAVRKRPRSTSKSRSGSGSGSKSKSKSKPKSKSKSRSRSRSSTPTGSQLSKLRATDAGDLPLGGAQARVRSRALGRPPLPPSRLGRHT